MAVIRDTQTLCETQEALGFAAISALNEETQRACS
jgi:hypothetical protein